MGFWILCESASTMYFIDFPRTVTALLNRTFRPSVRSSSLAASLLSMRRKDATPRVPTHTCAQPTARPGTRLPPRSTARRSLLMLLAMAWCLSHSAWALDVNRASAAQLTSLRGIGPKIAARILQERNRGGPFVSLDNLAERVNGIGSKTVRRLEAAGLNVQGRPVLQTAPSPTTSRSMADPMSGSMTKSTPSALLERRSGRVPVPFAGPMPGARRPIQAPTIRSGGL